MQINRLVKYGWKYLEDTSQRYFPWKIIPPDDQKRDTPGTLYKYFPLNENSVDSVENGYLYAPHPYQLNDLYDCHASLINFDNIQIVRNIFEKIIPDEEIRKGFIHNDKDFQLSIQFNYTILVFSRMGILSFTEDHLNIPMWSYYTNNQGFIIEFEYSNFGFTFHGPFQVNYQDEIQPVSVSEGLPLCTLYQTTLKTKKWEHEKEWRILPDKFLSMEMPGMQMPDDLKFADRKFSYSPNAVKRIIFGNRFFHNNDKELIDNNDGTFRIELKHNSNP